MSNGIRIAISVAGWVLRLLLWNVVALVPIFGNVRPAIAVAWLAAVVAFLTVRYVLPRGESAWIGVKRLMARPLPKRLGWIFALGVAGTVLNFSFAALGGDFLGSADNKSELALQAYADRPAGALTLLLFFVLFAPCFEEFVFRGKILGLLRAPLGPRGAVLVSALLFGALHAGQAGGVLAGLMDLTRAREQVAHAGEGR